MCYMLSVSVEKKKVKQILPKTKNSASQSRLHGEEGWGGYHKGFVPWCGVWSLFGKKVPIKKTHMKLKDIQIKCC